LGELVNNTAIVVGIEAMAAAQGIELRRPLKTSPLLEAEFATIRSRVAFLDRDRYLAPDLEVMRLWALRADDRTFPASLAALLPSQPGAFRDLEVA
jgi:histidine ammonia-lyase